MAKPAGEQTEEPTAKRRRDARERGEAARSTELPQSITLVAAVAVLIPTLTSLWGSLQTNTVGLITNRPRLEAAEIGGEAATAMRSAGMTLVPMLALLVVVSVIAQVAVAGMPNVWKLKPKFTSLNPQNGLKRIFSKQQLWELVRTILKLAALMLIALASWASLSQFVALGPAPLAVVFDRWQQVLQGLGVGVAILSLLIGFADTVVSKRNFDKGLRMSKQEVKDENKQAEGDPLVKGQIRQAQARMSRSRMIAAVADATVVVTNPTHYSVALRYQTGDSAPVVLAKGADELALRIRTEARRHGVPIKENKPVARTLFATAEVGAPIPVALYKAVAQLLASIHTASRPGGAAA